MQPVRGTRDFLPEDMRPCRAVIETAREAAECYGYQEMATPIFEFTEVFKRTLGETSDIVTKEMYSFAMREGEEITLRPENTAGVVRAMLSNGLTQSLPLKFFYAGPMFRHERPQKGRYRQFHQIGVELLGIAEPLGDVEVIALGARILKRLGITEGVTLELNTLGDPESRNAYRSALVEYFSDHREHLSDDSRARLERNPLRILDSKDEGDRRLVAEAPMFGDHLNAESEDFFAAVRAGLEAIGIAYRLNPRLVRGLDYYTHTAFEFTSTDLGAQSAVIAGGRYDGLVEMMGGPAIPGVGWAAGIERLAMLTSNLPAPARPLAVIPVGQEPEAVALALAERLRDQGHAVELIFSGNLKKRLRRADRIAARWAIILGESELESSAATLRDLDSGVQEQVALDALGKRLADAR
jgi:histidyl-tRNA synthetase